MGYDGFRADMWSLGICLFAMLAGFFPLDEAAGQDWRYASAQKAVRAGGSLTQHIFQLYSRPCPLSPEAIALLDLLLSLEPEQRALTPQALGAAWATGGKLDEQARAAVFEKGSTALGQGPQASFGSSMPSYDSSIPSYGGASAGSGYSSSVVSFGAQASMEMSFGSALAADAPVYRAFSGGPPPPPPGLTKQNAFVREMPE